MEKLTYFICSWIFFAMIGLSGEAIFKGTSKIIHDIASGRGIDWELPCKTWLWSIFVYGLSAAVCFHPAAMEFIGVLQWPWPWRGLFYAAAIFAVEFFWGCLLDKTIGFCPWDYRPARFAVRGYIRLDFAPFWFAFGFLLEKAALLFTRAWPVI
ncbi:MAG: hypothetical protein HY747_09620 [Elusimicrobia bacterium]|nr:hypothetical protein [Elusimicrobiota bacterium]